MDTKRIMFFSLLFVMFFCSCKDKITKDFLIVETTQIVFADQGDSRIIPCSSNAEIEVKSSQPAWCTVWVVDKGKAILVSVSVNEEIGAERERTATITVTAGKAESVQIEVKQSSQAPFFYVNASAEQQFGRQAAHRLFSVQTNVPFTATSSKPSWCTVSANPDAPSNNLSISITANDDWFNERTADVTVSASGFDDVKIRINQSKGNIIRSPVYLQNPAVDGITVMWLTNVPCHSWVEYGTDSMNMQKAQTWVEGIAMAYNTMNRIRITDLKPGTRYFYRVCSREITLYQPYEKQFGETAVGKISYFTTLDDSKTDFTAIIFNDLHDNYPLFDKLCKQIKDIPYQLVFFNGDCISDVQSEDLAVNTISHYSAGIGADKVPSIYVRGNHELRGAYSPFLYNLLGTFNGHTYGAFNFGDTRFVVLDCGEDKPDDNPVYYGLNDFTQFRKDQAVFLANEITSKEFVSASKRVLLHHIPMYGLTGYLPCRDLWHGVLSVAPFSICLNAHMHSLRYFPKGTDGNNYPVVYGGGDKEQDATVMILQKQGQEMTLTVLNVDGVRLLSLNL